MCVDQRFSKIGSHLLLKLLHVSSTKELNLLHKLHQCVNYYSTQNSTLTFKKSILLNS